MPLTEQRKDSIRQAVTAGRRVNRQATGRVTLPMGRSRYEILATSAGLTAAGAYHRTLTWATSGQHGLGGDDIIRVGNTEFLHPRGGKKQRLRTLMPNGEFQYTKAGNRYFQANDHFEYVLGMPVKITTHGGRQQGRIRHDTFPVSKMGVTGLLQESAWD